MTAKGHVELVDAAGNMISVPPDRAALMAKGKWKLRHPPPKPKPAPKPTGSE